MNGHGYSEEEIGSLSQSASLMVRQAAADQRAAPQEDCGSLAEAVQRDCDENYDELLDGSSQEGGRQ